MKRLFLIVSLVVLGIIAPASLSTVAHATTAQDEICMGANLDAAGCAATDDSSLRGIIHAAINMFSVTIAIVAVIMIIYAGFRYVTSEGDNGQIAAAKNTLLYAVVGLIVVAMAQMIVRFVVDNVT